MTRVNAGRDRKVVPQMLDDFRDLLEAAAEGKLSSGGVFDQDRQSAFCQIKPVR